MKIYECILPYCRAEVYDRNACCEDCWQDRRGQLASLPELYVMTYAMLTPGSRQQDIETIHVGSIDPAAPLNLVALDSLTYSYQRLAAWAMWVCRPHKLQLHAYTTGRGFLMVCRALYVHDSRLGRTDDAGQYCLDVWTAYRRLLVQVVPIEPRHLEVDCPECSSRTVYTRHADEYALCANCRTTWAHSQMPKLRQAQRTAAR